MTLHVGMLTQTESFVQILVSTVVKLAPTHNCFYWDFP